METQNNIGLDELQRRINKMCGVSDDKFIICFNKLAPRKNPVIDDVQCKVNALMGINDEEFFKYSGSNIVSNKDGLDTSPHQTMFGHISIPLSNGLQQRMNKICGVSDDVFFIDQNKVNPLINPSIDDSQRKVNKLMGVNDETFNKYNK